MSNPPNLAIASTIAAALTLAVASGTAGAENAKAPSQAGKEKCYGVAKAGENGCANNKGLHSCAGNSKISYDGADWKLVPAGTCAKLDGNPNPFDGVNPKKKA